ncbi:MAG: tannase/feruloyl esterase family alpha/beta hydrolase [Vicinamibacterales bacterium]
MKRHLRHAFAALVSTAVLAASSAASPALEAPPESGPACDALATLQLPDTIIRSSKVVAAGAFTAAGGRGGRGFAEAPAFCQVHGELAPTPQSKIQFEVWLPAANWNGQLQVVGNGGLAGTISYPAMATAVRDGFAAASTDTGHTSTESPSWLEDRERLIDYSYRGLHLTTVDAKAIVKAYYSEQARRAYYTGCSTGGKQGLMEAQRYPADFDGILAGDAANFWTHQMASEVWNGAVTSTPETNLPKEKLQLLQDASLKACDALDGAVDGLVSDPAHCHFNPEKLQCTGADSPTCLTAAQVGAVRKIYGGPTNPRTGKRLYPGLYPGGELGWAANTVINKTTKSGVSSYDFWGYAFYHRPDWPFPTFDFDRDVTRADEELAPITNATNPNLEEFRKLGHKLIYYHGAADPLIPAQNGIDYFESVVGMEKGLERAQSFYRAFLVPGLYHCSGGPGPVAFGTSQPAPASQRDADHDALRALERWVEQGTAPSRIVGTKYVDNDPAKGVALQRPLCAYPQVAKYNGSGDSKDAASFTCTTVK